MRKFINKKTGEVQQAYSIYEKGDRLIVKFRADGNEYQYAKSTIELVPALDNLSQCEEKASMELLVYSLTQQCYRCKKDTEVLTYMLFDDGSNENLLYPWDKERLNDSKSYQQTLAHMANEYIEFYPIKILGNDEIFDQMMLNRFPSRVRTTFSKTQNRTYPMNICQHCGAKQGEYFIYEKINKLIAKKTEIKLHASLPIL